MVEVRIKVFARFLIYTYLSTELASGGISRPLGQQQVSSKTGCGLFEKVLQTMDVVDC